MKLADYNRLRKRVAKATGRKLPAVGRGPDGMERRFNLSVLGGRGIFEPRHFEVTRTNRRVYTPDWGYLCGDMPVYVECKPPVTKRWRGHASRPRSQLAFEIAAEANPGIVWVWVEPSSPGAWKATAWYDGGKALVTAVIDGNAAFDALVGEVTKCRNG